MKARELPCPVFDNWIDEKNSIAGYISRYLPPYVTVEVNIGELISEVEIHPDRLDWFIENYPQQIGQEVKFTIE